MSLKSIGEVSLTEINSVVSTLDKNCVLNKLSAASQAATSAAYSLKLLHTNYRGPMVRVRRGSDNVERDFYGDLEGQLGTKRYGKGITLDTWLNGSTGFVRTWYDQSGNARHVEKTTAANQPSIYNTPVLDKLSPEARTAARGIYALHRVSSTYTGATIRIRRSTDNVEQDFHANAAGTALGTGLDGTGTLISSWLGGATAFVRTWYDQSGAGRHAEQTTISAQPVLNVNSLLVDFQNDNARFLNIPSGTVPVGVTNAQYTFVFQHGSVNNTGGGGIIGSGAASTNQANNFRFGATEGKGYWNYWWDNDYSMGGPSNYAVDNKVSVKYDGINRQGYINGTHFTAAASSGYTNSAGQQYIGKTIANEHLNGQLYFVYIFGSSLSDFDRITCENTRTIDVVPKINYRGNQSLSLSNTQVPSVAMTSNSSGGFIASASSVISGWEAFRAFNNNTGDGWHSEFTTAQYSSSTGAYIGSVSTVDVNGRIHLGDWLQLQCPSAFKLNAFSIVPRSGFESTRSPIDFVMLGSNNGSSWNLLDEEENLSWTTERLFNITRTVEPYSYYRLVTKRVGISVSASVQISELKLNPTTVPLASGEKTYSMFSTWNSNTTTPNDQIIIDNLTASNGARASLYIRNGFYGFSGWGFDLLDLVKFYSGIENKSVMVVNDALNPNITIYHNGFVHQGATNSAGSLSLIAGVLNIGELYNGTINEVIVISNAVTKSDALMYYTPNDNSIKNKPLPTPKIQLNFNPMDGERLHISNDSRAKALLNASSLQLLPNNTAVGNWNNFVQNTPANRPTYFNKEGIRNDLGYVNFNRTNSQHLSVGSTAFNIATNGGFTAVALVKFYNIGSTWVFQRLFDFKENNNNNTLHNNNIIALIFENPKTMAFFMFNGSTEYSIATSSNAVVEGEWALWGFRYNGSTRVAEIYKNGIVVASGTFGAAITNRTTTNNYIGASNWHNEGTTNMQLGGLYMFDRFLSNNELANLNNMMVYSPITIQPQILTEYNNSTANRIFYSNDTPRGIGYSAKFDNTLSSFYDLQDIPAPPMTYCFWFKTLSNNYQTIVGLTNSTRLFTSGGGIQLDYSTATNRLTLFAAVPSTWSTINIDNVLINTWYHIVITVDTNFQVQIYLNGVYQNQVTGTAVPPARSRFIIGACGDSSRGFNGNIYDFRVYDYILRADEISLVFDGGIRRRQNVLLPPQNYLVNHSNWSTKMKISQSGSYTPVFTGSGTNVQVQLTSASDGGSNRILSMERIQDYESFEFSFEIFTNSANADALWFFCGSLSTPGREDNPNSGFIVNFQVYNISGNRGIIICDNNGINVIRSEYSEWVGTSKWVPVIIKYRRNTINTWIVNVGGQDVIKYSNPNNESWISNSGSLWGIGTRTGAERMNSWVRRVQLTYQPSQQSNLSLSNLIRNNTLTKFPGVALTSANSNGYIVSASSSTFTSIGWAEFKAFDNNITADLGWHSASTYNSSTGVYTNINPITTTDVLGTVHSGEWLQLQSVLPIKLKSFSITPRPNFTDIKSPRSFVILGSNNGTSWNLLFTETNSNNWTRAAKTFTLTLNVPPYTYFRMVTKRVGNLDSGMTTGDVNITEWELYGDSFSSAVKYPSVALDSNTSNGHVVSASNSFSNDFLPFKAFDSNLSDFPWATPGRYNTTTGAYTATESVSTTVSGVNYLGEWLQIQFPSQITINHYSITARAGFETTQSPNTWYLAGSNNGTTWTLVDSRVGISNWSSTYRTQTFYLNNFVTYTYFRLICTVNGQVSNAAREACSIANLAFYGDVSYINPVIDNNPTPISSPNLSLEGFATGVGVGTIIPGCAVFDSFGNANNATLASPSYRNTKYFVCGGGQFRATTITIKQNSNFLNIPTFTRNHVVVLEASFGSGFWGHGIGIGFDQNNNGLISGALEEGPLLYYNSQASTVSFLNKNVSMWFTQWGKWTRFRIIFNLQDEIVNVLVRDETNGSNDYKSIPEFTNLPLNIDWTSNSVTNPTNWNAIYMPSSSDSLTIEGLVLNTYLASTWKNNMGLNLIVPTSTSGLPPNGLIQGLTWKYFSGNFSGDMINNFNTTPWREIGVTNNLTNLSDGTNSFFLTNVGDNFSVEWTGYFRPNVTGIWTFNLFTDDNGYLWLGSPAASGYTTSNGLINTNVSASSASIYLTAGVYYPIRIRFTEIAGGNDVRLSFTSPYGETSSDGTGFFFSSVGTNSAYPAESAKVIKEISYTNTDGVYFINVDGFSTPTYCLMNDAYDGGGWMMLMKGTRGTTFNYSANFWTTANTLNGTQTNRNDGDAKFGVFNSVPIKDVMAIFPDIASTSTNIYGERGGSLQLEDGWCWKVNNWNGSTSTTALAGFQNSRDAHPSNPSQFNGFSSNVFSSQAGARRHVFGGGTHIGSSSNIRWGLLWNNQGDFTSVDVATGIGITNNADTTASAGDLSVGAGTRTLVLNRTARFELYGR